MLVGLGFLNRAIGLEIVRAIATLGGQNRRHLSAIDYIFTEIGQWI